MQESMHKLPNSASQADLGRMQLTLSATRRTPHGASSFVRSMSTWSVKTRRTPPRHGRAARVYGLTAMNTTMHGNGYTPRPPRLLRLTQGLNSQGWPRRPPSVAIQAPPSFTRDIQKSDQVGCCCVVWCLTRRMACCIAGWKCAVCDFLCACLGVWAFVLLVFL